MIHFFKVPGVQVWRVRTIEFPRGIAEIRWSSHPSRDLMGQWVVAPTVAAVNRVPAFAATLNRDGFSTIEAAQVWCRETLKKGS